MSRNDDYKTRNLLGFSHHRNYFKLIGMGFSRQANCSVAQQTNFTEKLEEGDDVTRFSISKTQQKCILNCSLYSFIVTE